MRRLPAFALLVAAAPARADAVVVDFTVDPTPAAQRPSQAEQADLLRRFPHPHANTKTCDPNPPNTPADQRMGGQLLPTITSTRAAITRRGAQVVYLIDYCPTGVRVPRTRRLLVLDDAKVVLDKELPAALPADELLAAVDIDGDGFSELVATETIYRGGRNVVVAYLVRPSDLKVLGTWTAIEHCTPGRFPEENLHRVTFARGRFRDVASKRRCHYPP
jgi:hypothetical protein